MKRKGILLYFFNLKYLDAINEMLGIVIVIGKGYNKCNIIFQIMKYIDMKEVRIYLVI